MYTRYGIRTMKYVRERTENFGVRRDHGRIESAPEIRRPSFARETTMLYTIAVILVVLWLLGLVTAYTMGGFIHILLVVAIIAVLLRVINGRTPL
jgi:hypothetical protein